MPRHLDNQTGWDLGLLEVFPMDHQCTLYILILRMLTTLTLCLQKHLTMDSIIAV